MKTRFIAGMWMGQRMRTRTKTPLCGDVVRIELRLDKDGKVEDLYFSGEGCVISQASASMLLEEMQGKSVEEAMQFSAEQMLELYGPRLTPNRQKCCLLSWQVLQSAVHSPVKNAPVEKD